MHIHPWQDIELRLQLNELTLHIYIYTIGPLWAVCVLITEKVPLLPPLPNLVFT